MSSILTLRRVLPEFYEYGTGTLIWRLLYKLPVFYPYPKFPPPLGKISAYSPGVHHIHTGGLGTGSELGTGLQSAHMHRTIYQTTFSALIIATVLQLRAQNKGLCADTIPVQFSILIYRRELVVSVQDTVTNQSYSWSDI